MDTYQTQPAGVSAPKSGGSYAAVIIVILIIAVGGIYFWYSRAAQMPSKQTETQTQTQPSSSNEDLQKQLDAAGSVDVSADMNSMDEVYK